MKKICSVIAIVFLALLFCNSCKNPDKTIKIIDELIPPGPKPPKPKPPKPTPPKPTPPPNIKNWDELSTIHKIQKEEEEKKRRNNNRRRSF